MNTSDIKKMDVAARLQVMEAIWDSFVETQSEIQSPDWHGAVLDKRKQKVAEGKAEFISIEELKANKPR